MVWQGDWSVLTHKTSTHVAGYAQPGWKTPHSMPPFYAQSSKLLVADESSNPSSS